jgi:hypothetical protein
MNLFLPFLVDFRLTHVGRPNAAAASQCLRTFVAWSPSVDTHFVDAPSRERAADQLVSHCAAGASILKMAVSSLTQRQPDNGDNQ